MALTKSCGGSVRKVMNTDGVFLRCIPAETAHIVQVQRYLQDLMTLRRKLHGLRKAGIMREIETSGRKISFHIPIGKFGGYAGMVITGEQRSTQDRRGQAVHIAMDYCRENHILSADERKIIVRRSYAKDTRPHLIVELHLNIKCETQKILRSLI